MHVYSFHPSLYYPPLLSQQTEAQPSPSMGAIAEEPSGGEDTTSNEGSEHNTAEAALSNTCITLQVSYKCIYSLTFKILLLLGNLIFQWHVSLYYQ